MFNTCFTEEEFNIEGDAYICPNGHVSDSNGTSDNKVWCFSCKTPYIKSLCKTISWSEYKKMAEVKPGTPTVKKD